MHQHLHEDMNIRHMYGFICPHNIAFMSMTTRASKANHIADTMKGCEPGRLFFAPYNAGAVEKFISARGNKNVRSTNITTKWKLIQVICKKGCFEDAILVFDEMVRPPMSFVQSGYKRGLAMLGRRSREQAIMEFLERMKLDAAS